MKSIKFSKIGLSVSWLLLATTVALAANGGGSTGGGYGVGPKLLDFYEAEQKGIAYVNVTELPGYKEVVAPALDRVLRASPKFYREMLEIRDQKTWMLVGTELDRIDDAMTSLPVEQVGKQTDDEIELFRPWFERADLANKGGLIIHELIRGIAMKKGLDQETTRILTRVIALDLSLSPEKLILRLDTLGFGVYGYITGYGVDADRYCRAFFNRQAYITRMPDRICGLENRYKWFQMGRGYSRDCGLFDPRGKFIKFVPHAVCEGDASHID